MLQELVGHTQSVLAIAFAPDGLTLASSSSDGSVRIWDTKTGKSLRTLQGHKKSVLAIAFAPDGQRLASVSDDNTVRIWELRSESAASKVIKGHAAAVQAVSFSPDGKLLASGSLDLSVRIWDADTGKSFRTLKGHKKPVSDIAYAPDGQMLASASYDNTVRIWDIRSGATMFILKHDPLDERGVRAVAFAPDGRTLASAHEGTARIWDAATGELILRDDYADIVVDISFAPDGQTLALALLLCGEIRVMCTQTCTQKLTFEGAHACAVAFAPDGQSLASAAWREGIIRTWTTEPTDVAPKPVRGHAQAVIDIARAPNGQRIATLDGLTVCVWDISSATTPRMLAQVHLPEARQAKFAPDSRTLAITTRDNIHLYVFDDEPAMREVICEMGAKVGGIAFAFYSRTFAAGASDGSVSVWQIESGLLLHKLKGHTKPVNAVALSSDGQLIASGSNDKTVCVWNSGKLLQRFQHSSGILSRGCAIACLAFAPNAQTMASGTADGTLRVWELAVGEPQLALLASRLQSRGTKPLREIKNAFRQYELGERSFELQYSGSGNSVTTPLGQYRVNASTTAADICGQPFSRLLHCWPDSIQYNRLKILSLPRGFERAKEHREEGLLVFSHRDGTMSIFRVDETKLQRQIANRRTGLDQNIPRQ
jgi:WD40 repeat protein